MPTRTAIEGLLLSAGIIACAALAAGWFAASGWHTVFGAVTDGRLWSAFWASVEIGTVAGIFLALSVFILCGMLLYAECRAPRWVVALSLAIAMTPDLVHGLIWRSVAQPGIGATAFQSLLATPSLQGPLLGIALALKWSPLLIVVAASSLDVRRTQLRRTLHLAGTSERISFTRTTTEHIRRWALIGLGCGVLVGARQHELSETLIAGGVGLRAEGLSQWISAVAVSFLDPGRAAGDLLLILCILTAAGGVLVTVEKLVRVRRP